ncbi:MAG: hypothetical protein HQK91_13970 [Nitrospirae bacterium]|nr:hypothetical protein [Nitrospirota bacterium]
MNAKNIHHRGTNAVDALTLSRCKFDRDVVTKVAVDEKMDSFCLRKSRMRYVAVKRFSLCR